MELGAFTKVFPRDTLDETLRATRAAGIQSVQFNLSCAGLPSLPSELDPIQAADVADALFDRGINVAALSGTFNMAHPDPAVREAGVRSLGVLAAFCPLIECTTLTICTGTRNPDDMWTAHPDNKTEGAWFDMVTTIRAALEIVRPFKVRLAFEPEPGNVVRTAEDGVRLINELNDPLLGVIFDPANILAGIPETEPVTGIRHAIELLGYRTYLAHGKDLGPDGHPCAAGSGIVPWLEVVRGLIFAGYGGPLILHGLSETELPDALAILEQIPGTSRRAPA